MAPHYHLLESAAMPVPVPSFTGRFLAHNRAGLVTRAFVAADLYSGAKALTKPTMTQSAFLARVSDTYGWWALKRMAERAEIEAGLIPLVPPAHAKPNGSNGAPLVTVVDVADAELVEFVRSLGVERVLQAACLVEAAQ